jgi:DNA-directed RNA polymerase specialized sigma subunit
MDDLMQTAYFGLLEAAKTFNPEFGFKFLTHAKYYITGTVRREVNRSNGIPDRIYTLVQRYKHYCDTLSEEQILAHMGISESEINLIKQYMVEVTSLDKTLNNDGGTTLADILPDDSLPDVNEALQQHELQRLLWAEVDKLPEKLRAAIVNHYWLNAERNYLLENKALRRLRNNHKLMRRLKELLL